MTNIIKHVAIIMDGNRRWAKKNNCSYENSYKKATNSIKCAIDESINQKVEYLTLFAFSTENNKRSIQETTLLKNLINNYLDNEVESLLKNNIKVEVIGDYKLFDKKIASKLDIIQDKSKNNTALNLIIALNYSGKQDILQAVNKIYKNKLISNNTKPVDEIELEENLFTYNMPTIDILIRTGNSKRISNFCLWQIAYTELFFLDILWPDFNNQHFLQVVEDFKKIERKYGK